MEGEIKNNKALKKTLHILIFQLLFLGVLASCQDAVEHTAPAIHDRDSVATMTTYGVNTLISDSGVIKYRIVTEEWEVNTIKNPSFWAFNKGVFMEQFDEKFHVEAYVQADTAYFYDQQKLWELRSRVRILTKDGLRFSSEQLFWDQMKHEFYSNVFSKLVTPERTLQGSYFRSDERMTKYYVSNTKGSFEKGDFEGDNSNTDTARSAQDTVQKPVRQMATPQRRTTTSRPLTH